MSVLVYFVQLCEPFMDRANDESLALDGEFKPNLKNSIMFIYQWWMQTTVIFVNYSGRPFMEDITENKKLRNLLAVMFFTAMCLIFDVSPDLRDYLELTPFPNRDF